ncbi:hypothetical protein ACIQUY_04790 [Streptomyces sp. NPDC090231]|uniref:hypothetical protein n=1 Tax=unclassified Streptomyces TaxID=2593676 RepID=UPI00380E5623
MSSSELDRPERRGVDVSIDDLPTLQMDDIAGESEELLQARGAAYAREYARVEGTATTLLRNLATVIVAIRVKHDDMRGSSNGYRQVVAAMYRDAGIPPDSAARVQGAVRWHISTALRRYMTPRELEKHNLQPTSALERLQDARAVDSIIVKASKTMSAVDKSTPKRAAKKGDAPEEAGQPVRATADHLRLAQVAKNILDKFDRNVIKRDMTDGQRAALDKELVAMERKLASLRKLTQKPRSGA